MSDKEYREKIKEMAEEMPEQFLKDVYVVMDSFIKYDKRIKQEKKGVRKNDK